MNPASPVRPTRRDPLAAAARYRLRLGSDRCVDLAVEPCGALLRLSGQVLGPAEPGTVELATEVAGGLAAQVVPMDEGGAFQLDAVLPGLYVLTLRLDGDTLELPAFRIGPAEA